MNDHAFDYEDVCMGVRDKKPKSYFRSFARDYRLRSLIQSVDLGKGKLLDIGCGGGMISETLPYYYPKGALYGADVSKSAITYAKKYGSGKVAYSHMKGKRLPYKDSFFDVCICLDVLEHVPDVDFFLKEVKRVLKKVVHFCHCAMRRTATYLHVGVSKLHRGQNLTFQYFGHIHPEFTHAYVLELLKKHGFVIRETRYSEHVFYQFMHLCIFFLPKLLMEIFLGKKIAHEYTNSSLIHKPKLGFDPLLLVRSVWFAFFDFMMMHPMAWETILCSHIPFGAWKLHALAVKEKNIVKRGLSS